MNKITAYLDALAELERKATKGPWVGDFCGDVFTEAEKEFCPGMNQEIFRTIGSTKCGPGERDSVFIAQSRNALPKLLEAMRVLVEACSYYDHHDYRDNEIENGYTAREGLKRVEAILNDGTLHSEPNV